MKNIFEKVEFLLKMWKIVIWIKVDSVMEKMENIMKLGKMFLKKWKIVLKWKMLYLSGKCY